MLETSLERGQERPQKSVWVIKPLLGNNWGVTIGFRVNVALLLLNFRETNLQQMCKTVLESLLVCFGNNLDKKAPEE